MMSISTRTIMYFTIIVIIVIIMIIPKFWGR